MEAARRLILSQVLVVQNQKNLAIQVGRHNDLFQKNEADAEVTNVAVGIANAGTDATATADADAVLRKAAIFQSQKNLGIQVGHGNDMNQKNEADAELENVAVAIADATISNEEVGGNSNQYASSDASADAYASLSKVMIEQSQKNLGIQVGHGNDMKQKNEADAEVENKALALAGAHASNLLVYVPDGNGDSNGITYQNAISLANSEADAKLSKAEIEQSQRNLGIQVGNRNDLSEENEADVEIENEATAKAFASASNDESIAQSAYQSGSGATALNDLWGGVLMDATSSASADAFAKLSKIEVEQTQANLGVQVGSGNDMYQKNNADAEVDNAAVSKARADASNDLDVHQFAAAGTLEGNAHADAENEANTKQDADSSASADDADAVLTKAKIQQVQANLGVQVGLWNEMSQRNNADAGLENVAVVKAGAFTSNSADVDQIALAGATSTSSNPSAGARAEGENNIDLNQVAGSIASADAFAKVDKAKIGQCQANLGVQVGIGNDMSQKNSADAEIENAAIAMSGIHSTNSLDVDQNADAGALADSYWWGHWHYRPASATATTSLDVDQTATGATYADSYAKLSKSEIQQAQANLGVQVGFGNLLFQKNKEDAEIENSAVAFSHVDPGTAVPQSQSALAIALPGMTVTDPKTLPLNPSDIRSPISGDASATLYKISIEQCQKNLGVQVGHNFMVQKNDADAEVEQSAFNTAENLHKVSIEQKQKNALVQVGSSAIFQIGEQSDSPTQSHTHIDRSQSNTLVVVNHIGGED